MRGIRVDHGLGIWDGYVITIRPEPVFFFFFFFFLFLAKMHISLLNGSIVIMVRIRIW